MIVMCCSSYDRIENVYEYRRIYSISNDNDRQSSLSRFYSAPWMLHHNDSRIDEWNEPTNRLTVYTHILLRIIFVDIHSNLRILLAFNLELSQ
jgi:hypothetical protein